MANLERGVRVAGVFVAIVGVVTALLLVQSLPAGATVTTEGAFRAAWTAGISPIDLDADITLSCTNPGGAGVAITNTTTPIVVDGHGFSLAQTCTTGAGNGLLLQGGAGLITLQNLTMTGGNKALNGGAIFASSVEVKGSTIANNSVWGTGGAIFAGAVAVTDSTITNNYAVNGGGIGSDGDDPMFITNSTIVDNHANIAPGGVGGGVFAVGAVIVRNSTISSNSATKAGGAIIAGLGIALVYSTVTDNQAPDGASFSGAGLGTLSSFASVITRLFGSEPNCVDLTGTTSSGFNFADDASCDLIASTDHQDSGDLSLGMLDSNGGLNQTREPHSGSPLIDAVPGPSCQNDGAVGITTDQRGVTRPQGLGCDSGAVEVKPAAPSPPPFVLVAAFTG